MKDKSLKYTFTVSQDIAQYLIPEDWDVIEKRLHLLGNWVRKQSNLRKGAK